MSSPPEYARIGMGCMRLSTERDRDESRGIEVLHAAFDGGVTFFDTADAYCLDDSEVGHNERLIARALATWSGDRSRIVVATKGGLTRPHGEWVPDGQGASSARRVRSQPAGARRRAHPAVSASRARSAHAARDQRARARGAEGRGPHRARRPVQRQRRPDRGSPPHHRDLRRAGGGERLARREPPQRRRRVLHRT